MIFFKKIKVYLNSFFSHPIFNFFISFIIIISLILLCLEKMIDLKPSDYYLIEKIDFIIVVIFTIEFTLKFLIGGFTYFLKDYGWVDFLCVLPIFTTAFRSIRILRGIRSIRLVRLLRLLRIIRILKIPHYYNFSPLKQKVFIPTSTLAIITVLITGFIFINSQENLLINYQKEKFKEIIRSGKIKEHKELIKITRGNRIIFEQFKEDLNKIFLPEHLTYINDKGLTYTFSLKSTFRQLDKFELKTILISIIALALLIITLNLILDRTILNPIIMLKEKLDKIVTIKEVPSSGDRRVTVNFSHSIDYPENDEIGSIVKKFNHLLNLLKKQHKISKNALSNLCSTVMNIFEYYHTITRGHQYRTAMVAAAIAVRMGFCRDEIEDIFYGTMLHDIGKISVDKKVLMKPDKFNKEEEEEMRRHPVLGYKMGLDFPLLSEVELLIIRDHHERLGGKGYPVGLEGDEIAQAARIAAVADIFDAIICPRDYKIAKPVQEVMGIINDMAGHWLDKKIIQVLEELVSEKIIIVDCTLNNENKWITIDEDKLGTKIDFLNESAGLNLNDDLI